MRRGGRCAFYPTDDPSIWVRNTNATPTIRTDFGRRKAHSLQSRRIGREEQARQQPKLVPWQRTYKHRHTHQEVWLAVLRLSHLPSRTQKRVLQHLSGYVLAMCPSPLRFAEYFSRSFQLGTGKDAAGGGASAGTSSLASILSLQGLFVLMLDHRLEYPQFYNSLHRLLHPRILYTKHRAQFLRLLSKSLLSNSMLPAYVDAAFSKRLCRLALAKPPSGALFALALVSNLLRKHGECACLVHRRGEVDDGVCVEDVFMGDVEDLADSCALESSLWELGALERHYHPAVAAMAGAVGTEDDRTTPKHDVEESVVHPYKLLFETEKKQLGSGGGNRRKGRYGKVSLEGEVLIALAVAVAMLLVCVAAIVAVAFGGNNEEERLNAFVEGGHRRRRGDEV